MDTVYRNLKTSKDVTILKEDDYGVQVKYIESGHKSNYTQPDFYKNFVKVTQDS